jgi:hypothetical protein
MLVPLIVGKAWTKDVEEKRAKKHTEEVKKTGENCIKTNFAVCTPHHIFLA